MDEKEQVTGIGIGTEIPRIQGSQLLNHQWPEQESSLERTRITIELFMIDYVYS